MGSNPQLDVVQAFFNALEKGDGAAVAACFSDDAVVWTPGRNWYSGEHDLAEIQTLSARILAQFPKGLRFEIQGITAEGERVAVEATSRGEHVNGRTYANAYHMLFTVRDGAIASLKEYMDTELAGDFLGRESPPA